jgi:hypothetical protein
LQPKAAVKAKPKLQVFSNAAKGGAVPNVAPKQEHAWAEF